MQVNDQVKVKTAPEGDEESVGRAGMIVRIEGPADSDRTCTVKLDETKTHEDGEADYLESQLEFLGR
jgi:hypothetical protein